MLVMREEQFLNRGIDRDNAQRVNREQAARTQRQAAGIRNNRVDNQQPMYSSNAPTHSGGSGALGPWLILLLLPVFWGHFTNRNRH
jgi:Ca-activated chloride channel family protein